MNKQKKFRYKASRIVPGRDLMGRERMITETVKTGKIRHVSKELAEKELKCQYPDRVIEVWKDKK